MKKFDYALLFLEFVKRKNGEFVDVRTAAEELNIPHAYLEKVVQELKRAGWLEGRRGAGGGYRLAKKAANASVASLLGFYESIKSFCPVLRELKK